MKRTPRKRPPMIYFSAEHYETMRAAGKPRVFVAVLKYMPALHGAEHMNLHATQEMLTCTELKPLDEIGDQS